MKNELSGAARALVTGATAEAEALGQRAARNSPRRNM
jgi:hypothetical protein